MGDTFLLIDCPHHPHVRVSSVIDAFGVCDEAPVGRAPARRVPAGLNTPQANTTQRKPTGVSVRSKAIGDGRTPLLGNNFNREPRIADSKKPQFSSQLVKRFVLRNASIAISIL